VVRGDIKEETPPAEQAEVWFSDDELVLRLRRRKNRLGGSR